MVDHSRETWDGYVEDLWIGHDDVMKGMKEGVSKHFVSHHVITNHQVETDGDRARAVAYLHSVHVDDAQRPDVHEDHGAWYLSELVRVAGAWKISRLKHVALWRENMLVSGPVLSGELEEAKRFLE